MAISCSHGQRSMSPLTKPSACRMFCCPLLRKSPILASQPQPVQATPWSAASWVKGAMPAESFRFISSWFLAWLIQRKLLSSRPHATVMLLTIMSKLPLASTSPKSTPMPLNEPLPSTKDFGVVGVRSPVASSNRIRPGVETLCSRWAWPKSLAM